MVKKKAENNNIIKNDGISTLEKMIDNVILKEKEIIEDNKKFTEECFKKT